MTCVERTAKIGFLSSKVAPFLHTECQAAILASIVLDMLVFDGNLRDLSLILIVRCEFFESR